jgi:hypothetical protein
MPIRRHSFWQLSSHHPCLLEETLPRPYLEFRSASNRPDCRLGRWLGTNSTNCRSPWWTARLTFTLGAKLLGKEWCRANFPFYSARYVGHRHWQNTFQSPDLAEVASSFSSTMM